MIQPFPAVSLHHSIFWFSKAKITFFHSKNYKQKLPNIRKCRIQLNASLFFQNAISLWHITFSLKLCHFHHALINLFFSKNFWPFLFCNFSCTLKFTTASPFFNYCYAIMTFTLSFSPSFSAIKKTTPLPMLSFLSDVISFN